MILVLESPGNLSWRSRKVLESVGMQKQLCGCEIITVRTPLVLMICSYSNKTFFLRYMWQWWTLQYGCYCHTLICRVSNWCLSLYLHVAGDYNRVLENTFGVLKKCWNLFWARQWEPWRLVNLQSLQLIVTPVSPVIILLTSNGVLYADVQIFYRFVSFLTPGIIYQCDMTRQQYQPSVSVLLSFIVHQRSGGGSIVLMASVYVCVSVCLSVCACNKWKIISQKLMLLGGMCVMVSPRSNCILVLFDLDLWPWPLYILDKKISYNSNCS